MVGYSSKLFENAVNELAKLPGIGKKTAMRLALYLMRKDPLQATALGNSIIAMRNEIRFCRICHNISDTDICTICSNPKRDHHTICIVEDIQDIMAIENTNKYFGVYHVLGGKISPIDGIGPESLNIRTLEERISQSLPEEIIFALSPTLEGDTTSMYLFRLLWDEKIHFSTIARGIAFGDELEYTDDITLGKSIENRIDFDPEPARWKYGHIGDYC